MVSAFSFGIRKNEQKKEADKAAEVEKAEFFCVFCGSRLFRKARKSENHILERNEYNEVPDY